MLSISDTEFASLITQWLFPFLRIAGLMMTAPVIGTRVVPGKIRVVVTIAIALVIVPTASVPDNFEVFSFAGLLVAAQQVLVGALIGIVLRLVFLVVELAGQIIAQQMGLGFASLVDPQTGLQVPVFSQFYIVLATLAFFALDGHLILITILADSFHVIPVGPTGVSNDALALILDWSSMLFQGALAIALPTVIALLVVNLAFGVMARSAPQLNVFAVGFPVMILFGVFMSYLTLDNLAMHLRMQFDQAFAITRQLLAA